jgi:predicted house-cleaning noncanonical NTP pyrophosphatase (MazG superfamily)
MIESEVTHLLKLIKSISEAQEISENNLKRERKLAQKSEGNS